MTSPLFRLPFVCLLASAKDGNRGVVLVAVVEYVALGDVVVFPNAAGREPVRGAAFPPPLIVESGIHHRAGTWPGLRWRRNSSTHHANAFTYRPYSALVSNMRYSSTGTRSCGVLIGWPGLSATRPGPR